MTGPLILIVLGILFLLNNMYPEVYRFRKMWPVILIVIGLGKVIEYLQGSGDNPAPPVALKKVDNLQNTEERKESQ